VTTPRFDELIHAPTRLAIISLLAASEWAEFKFIRDSVALSDSALSKQLTLLEEAGYVEIRKGFVGKRPRTWAKLSVEGRHAFEGHVLKLQELVSPGGLSVTGPDSEDRNERRLEQAASTVARSLPLDSPQRS
jgi:DNA-binding transcriptional ArsR family regulator